MIEINDDVNSICFRIQNGPIKEVGVNGCQVDTLIEAARLIIEGLNLKYPCQDNDYVIGHLTCAIGYLKSRKKDRETRGVEGTNQL
jgi:hypothetical protein